MSVSMMAIVTRFVITQKDLTDVNVGQVIRY